MATTSTTTTTTTDNADTHTPSTPEFTVDSADIIRLMLGYLTSLGLHQSATILRQESGIGFTSHSLVSKSLPMQIRQGEWGTVLRALRLSQESNPLLVEQIILELAERDDSLPMAYNLLSLYRDELDQIVDQEDAQEAGGDKDSGGTRQQQSLHQFSKARTLEQRLAAISANIKKYAEGQLERNNLLYGHRGGNRQIHRNQLADDMERNGIPVPLDRLPTLIQQACKWQSFTGQLPWIQQAIATNEIVGGEDKESKHGRHKPKKRKHLDLVRGIPSGTSKAGSVAVVGERNPLEEGDEEDDAAADGPIPYDHLAARVKFGKAAVCEAACFVVGNSNGTNGGGLITASSDGLIEIWDSSYQELNTTDYPFQKDTVMGHDAAILSMAISNDQTLLGTGDATGKVKIWKLATGKCLRQYQAHQNASATCLAFPRDSSRLLTGSAAGTCREFGLVSQHILQEYTGHTSYIHSCQYVMEYRGNTVIQWIVTSSADGTVRLWQQGQCLQIWQPNSRTARPNASIVVDPTGVLTESPAILTVVPISSKNQLLVVPRASTAYIVDFKGTIVRLLQANSSDTEFVAGTVSQPHSTFRGGVYLCTLNDCLVFRIDNGKCQHTITDFGPDSTTKTTGTTSSLAEVSQLLHHPTKPILAAFSNDKTQKKGILAVWK